MRCQRCNGENPPQAKFCVECAVPLTRTCAQCGTTLPPTAKFCPECAHPTGPAAPRFTSPDSYTPRHLADKILTSRSALEGERKQVTVLFADVSGFTSLSERLDPEDVHALMNRAFELMLGEVHRYEGTVNQFLGDGIMALFGAPIAHEDHAQRAVHAALGIQRTLAGYEEDLQRRRGITFQVRQGLNTGLVVVGSIGTDLRMDYTAVGDTTNVAARLEQGADPGRIVISAATHRLVAGYFYTRPLGELALKGKAEPVPAWEVIGSRVLRTRLEVESERGLTPYVGRDRELTLFMDAFTRARAGHGQIVFILGEPGLGKSRLLLEFRRRLGDEAAWVEGHCMSFGRSIAFYPLIDLLRRNFRIEEGDSEEAIIRKVERAVLRLGEDLRSTLPYVRYLLSVDPGDPTLLRMDAQQRRGEIFEAVRRLTMRAAEVHPQVCVFEDLHWMDRGTEDYLLSVADSVATSRILLVLTYRPGYAHPFGERSYHSRIALTALSSEDSTAMARAVLGAATLPDDLSRLIVGKAEGNPFFVEEVTKSLLEGGAIRRQGEGYIPARPLDEIVVPDTIQDVIMARIDRLEEASKKTLQLASVIGREFTRRLLERIADIRGGTDEFLRELKAIELIYEKSAFPELAYMFKHALTHDVAYHSLLVQRRKELHRLIGLAIEELYVDRLAEHYEVLAYHFARGEEWTKALHYLREAGTKAAARSAFPEAVSHFEGSLLALEHLPESRARAEQAVDLRFALRNVLVPLGDYGRLHEVLREAEELAEGLGDERRLGRVTAYRAHYLWATVDHERAVECGRRALAIGASVHDVGLQVAAAYSTAYAYHDLARYPEAIELLQGNINLLAGELTRERFGFPNLPSVSSRNLFAWCRAWQGDFAEGLRLLEESAAITETVDHAETRATTVVSVGLFKLLKGDVEEAVEKLERALSIRRAAHIRSPALASFLAHAYTLAGRAPEALPLFEQSLEEAAAIKFLPCNSLWIGWWGEACLAVGRPAEATDLAVRALEISRTQKERGYEAYALRLMGDIATRSDQPQVARAESAYAEAIALATTLGMRPLLARCHLGFGRLYRSVGDRGRAREGLVRAASMLGAMQMPLWLGEAQTELAALA